MGQTTETRDREAASRTDREFGSGQQASFWYWFRQTARLWGFFAFVLVVLIIFRSVTLPFVLGLLVAYVLAPLVTRLSKTIAALTRFARPLAIAVVYSTVIGLTVLFLTSFVPRVSQDLKRVVQEVPGLLQRGRAKWAPRIAAWIRTTADADTASHPPPVPPLDSATASPPEVRIKMRANGELALDLRDLQLEAVPLSNGGWIVKAPGPEANAEPPTLSETIQRRVDEMLADTEAGSLRLFSAGQKIIAHVFTAITTVILVFTISLFLLLDSGRLLTWLKHLVPLRYHPDFDEVLRRVDLALSGAIRGQLLICLVNGLLTAIGLTLIGVKYQFLLALLAAVFSLIPFFGSILSTIPIVTVALVSAPEITTGLTKGLLVLAWIIGIHLLEANLLNPKIIGRTAKMHPVMVMFAVLAGERTYGPVGALLAVPIVSAVQALFIYLRAKAGTEAEV